MPPAAAAQAEAPLRRDKTKPSRIAYSCHRWGNFDWTAFLSGPAWGKLCLEVLTVSLLARLGNRPPNQAITSLPSERAAPQPTVPHGFAADTAGRGRREGSGAESLAPPAPHTQGGLPQGQEAQQGEDEQQGGKRLWRERRWPMNVDRVQGMAQREAEERDVDAITVTVEMLNDRFGKELVLYLICRVPKLIFLEFDIMMSAPKLIFLEFDVMMSRAEATRSMLDLRPMDMLMILRKNPYLMCLDTALVRSRYDALSRVMPLSRDSVRTLTRKCPLILNRRNPYRMCLDTALVRSRYDALSRVMPLSRDSMRTLTRKCPLILNRRTELIGDVMESLRQISYTRVIWQENFDLMTPSLMAFFMRDFAVLLMRLEFLLVTGRSPNTTLKDVFKPSTNLFANVHRGYRPWLAERRERQRVQLERAQAAAQLREAAVSESGRRYKRGGSPGEEVEDEEEQYFRQEREW
eukprot:gene31743-6944_t